LKAVQTACDCSTVALAAASFTRRKQANRPAPERKWNTSNYPWELWEIVIHCCNIL